MITKWRIIFSDQSGEGCLETDDFEEYKTIINNLNSDPLVEDIFVDYFDPECGWIC